jgi:hypothetical protein
LIDTLIKTPTIRRFMDDWRCRLRGRQLPARSDFDILDLKYVIGNLNLFDVLYDPLRFRYRVHGSNAVSIIGCDMTGKTVDDHSDIKYRELMTAGLTRVITTRTVYLEERNGLINHRQVNFEILLLPLSNDGIIIDKIFAAYGLLDGK